MYILYVIDNPIVGGDDMSYLEKSNFDEFITDEKIFNPVEPHIACAFLIDTSDAMKGDVIESLNKSINLFKEQTSLDEIAQQHIDIAIIEFNDSARVVQDFTPLPLLKPVTLVAHGCAAMGEGINLAIDKVKERNRFYANMGTPYFKPWIFMITGSEPSDNISSARQRIIGEESKDDHGKLKFWAVGVLGYSKETLQSLTKCCIALDEANFSGIFDWMSESMVAISVSRVDENPQLPNLPKGAQVIPTDW